MSNPNLRTYGTILLDKNSNHETEPSPIITRKFDTELYEKTGELKYLEEESVIMSRDISIENTRRMREEITTLEQFDAIGNYPVVAKHYGVSTNTAYLYRKALIANSEKGKENPESSELQDKHVQVTEGCVGALEDTGEHDYPNEDKQSPESVISESEKDAKFINGLIHGYAEETIDDLKGLVEPEPAWTCGYAGEVKPYSLDETIEQREKLMESELAFLSELYRKRADKDFKSRVMKMMEAI